MKLSVILEGETPASAQAKAMGLIYARFGRYKDPRTGQLAYVTDKATGRLIPFIGDNKPGGGGADPGYGMPPPKQAELPEKPTIHDIRAHPETDREFNKAPEDREYYMDRKTPPEFIHGIKLDNVYEALRFTNFQKESGIELPVPMRKIGSGKNGTVYDLSAPGKVLKLTGNEDEIQIASQLKEVNIPGVWQIDAVYNTEGLPVNCGVIVGERLKADSDRAKSIWHELRRFFAPRDGSPDPMGTGTAHAKDAASYSYDMLSAMQNQITEDAFKVAEAMSKIGEYGIPFSNLDEGNIMFNSKDEPVIMDLDAPQTEAEIQESLLQW